MSLAWLDMVSLKVGLETCIEWLTGGGEQSSCRPSLGWMLEKTKRTKLYVPPVPAGPSALVSPTHFGSHDVTNKDFLLCFLLLP